MPDKQLLIYCAGGLGREVLELARQIGKWNIVAFIDDSCSEREVNGAPVYSFEEAKRAVGYTESSAVVASGEPQIVKKLYERLEQTEISLAKLIHPSVHIPDSCLIEPGVIVQDRVFLGPNVILRKGCCIDYNCALGHDVQVEEYSHISMGCMVAGHVTIGDGTYIGAGAVIRDEVTIGKNCIIGMGSLVTKNIPDSVMAYGFPCRAVKENTEGIVFR